MATRIRWDVQPHMFTMTHPATGVQTTIYDAVRVSIGGPDGGAILHSEYPRARRRAIDAVRARDDVRGPITVTPIYTPGRAAVAYVVAYRTR